MSPVTCASMGRTCTALPPVSLWFQSFGGFPTAERMLPIARSGQAICATVTEWTVARWGRTPQVGNAQHKRPKRAVEGKNYIIQDNKQICTSVYPTLRVQDNQPK